MLFFSKDQEITTLWHYTDNIFSPERLFHYCTVGGAAWCRLRPSQHWASVSVKGANCQFIRKRNLPSYLIFDFVDGIKKPTDPGGAILLLEVLWMRKNKTCIWQGQAQEFGLNPPRPNPKEDPISSKTQSRATLKSWRLVYITFVILLKYTDKLDHRLDIWCLQSPVWFFRVSEWIFSYVLFHVVSLVWG